MKLNEWLKESANNRINIMFYDGCSINPGWVIHISWIEKGIQKRYYKGPEYTPDLDDFTSDPAKFVKQLTPEEKRLKYLGVE